MIAPPVLGDANMELSLGDIVLVLLLLLMLVRECEAARVARKTGTETLCKGCERLGALTALCAPCLAGPAMVGFVDREEPDVLAC